MKPYASERVLSTSNFELDDATFALLQALILRKTGIHLPPAKKALVVGRLGRRLLDLGIPSFLNYYRHVTSKAGAGELTNLIDAITTNETQFWRDERQFTFLENEVLPRWVEDARRGTRGPLLQAWSAASSTGEEPYTMAMVLLAALDGTPWGTQVLATDISTRALEHAVSGTWPVDRSAAIPPAHLKRFMLRGTGSQLGNMRVGRELRSTVRFVHRNLLSSSLMDIGPFDVVFCRNVLIYFDEETRRAVLERIVSRLTLGGYLFLGHAETPPPGVPGLRGVAPNIYARVEGSGARPARGGP